VLATYVALTKPRVIELLLVTTVPAMVLAERGLPSLALVAAVLVGGGLAAGGANTINCWIERDRDQLMRRTRHRPLPTGAVDPSHALVFGLLLEVVAFATLWAAANLLAAALAIAATVFYVFVYTIWLKPRTVQNIVIGGAAGAVPVLVGWAAVTGSLALPALVLFAVVFCWTPAHFWALALRYREDYAAAGFPMLPVVRGPAVAATQILVYAVIVSALTLMLPLVASMGVIYWVVAATLGLVLIVQAARLRRDPSEQRAIAFFSLSNTYLAILFAAVALDILVRYG
jgi:protoheme IX farnesyltransferase